MKAIVGARGLVAALVLGVVLGLSSIPAAADIVAHISLSRQVMDVSVDGRHFASWKVSTGRKGFRTPTGSWRPKVLRRMHYSSKYDNSPMPHSVFYHGGYAVHGTNYVKRLGQPASHGCVRLHPTHAATFFNLVQSRGMRNALIRVTN